jgi:WD40 repeat protein
MTMSIPSESLDYGRFDELAEEFAERYRRGERPNLQEFVDRLPEMADEIREMFPALVEVELADEARGEAIRPPLAAPTLGQIGDYQIVREIGRGGMGVVYEAFQVSLGRRVALKILPANVASNSKALSRFRREAKAAARLHHTNIVPVFEVGQEGEVAFYAMQFIQGQGLDQVIDELTRLRKPDRNPVRRDHNDRRSGGLAGPRRTLPSVATCGSRNGNLERVAESLLSGRLETQRAVSSAATAFAATDPGHSEPLDLDSTAGAAPPGAGHHRVGPPSEAGLSSSAVLPGGTAVSSVESSNRRQPYFRSVAHIGRQAAQGLAYAHSRGIVHRDIKPSNLLLDNAGVVWITDFGLAKAEEDGLTLTGDVLGTLQYMAPERFRGGGDARADIYALGLTLYELLTLRPAFRASDRLKLMERINSEDPPRPRSLDGSIPRDLETIVQTAIDKDPRGRYASAEAMAEDLRRFLADEPIQARQASALERYWRWARRNRTIATLGGVLAAILLFVAVGALFVAGRMVRLVEKERIAGHAERASRLDADQARETAEKSQAAAQAETYRALLSEVKALRAGRPLGWRDDALKNLARLASSPTDRRNLVELRNEAVDCLCELDIVEVAQFEGRGSRVWSLEFGPDSRTLAMAVVNGDVDLWDIAHRRHLRGITDPAGESRPGGWPFPGDPQMLVRFLPDGTLAQTTWSHRIGFQLASGRPAARPPIFGGKAQAIGLAIDREGRLLAVGWNDGRIDIHDAGSGTLLRSSRCNSEFLDFDLSPDGRWLGSCGPNHEVQIRPAEVDGPPIALGRHRGGITSIAFSPDGMILASTSSDQTAKLWDIARREERLTLRGHKERVNHLAFSPDGRLIATTSQDYTARAWDARTGQTLAVLPGSGFRQAAAFSPDGRYLALQDQPVSGGNDTLRLYELVGRRERRLLVGHVNGTQCLAFHPRLPLLASGADDHAIIIWDAESARALRHWTAHEHFVGALAFSPNGSLVASGQGDTNTRGRVCLWDAQTGALRRDLCGHASGVHAAAFDSTGERLATGDASGVLIVWDVHTGQVVRREVVGPSWVWSVPFFDDDRRLVTEVTYGPVVVYDMKGTEPPRQVAVPGGMRRFVIDRIRNAVIVAGEGSTVTRVSLRDLAVGHHLDKGHNGMIASIAISPDGRLLATGGGPDRRIVLRDAETFEPLLTFPLWTGMVKDLAFDATGRWLAIAGADSDVGLWDIHLVHDELAALGLSWDQAPPAVLSASDIASTDERPQKEVPVIRPTTIDPDEFFPRHPFAEP